MSTTIRRITEQDREQVLEMMQVFYASPAVLSNGSPDIFAQDLDACLNDDPFLEGYVFDSGKELQGYAMIAKSFSVEFGKRCIWIEDLFIKDTFRGRGLGKAFLGFITNRYDGCLFRLEVEQENTAAVALYEKYGFTCLPYMEMKR